MRLLVDRSVRAHSQTVDTVEIVKPLNWGGMVVESRVVGYQGRELGSNEWRRSQILSLPTIARMAKEKKLKLFTTNELEYESFYSSVALSKHFTSIFHDIEFFRIPSAVGRSWFESSADLDETIGGKAHEAWYQDFLLKITPEQVEHILQFPPSLPESAVESLRNLCRFRELCTGLSDSQCRDAFHLWCAEVGKMDFFLTMDKKFVNVIRQTKSKIELPCKPIFPTELLQRIRGTVYLTSEHIIGCYRRGLS